MRLVVFDLDGTLIDSRKDLTDSVNAMLEELGRPALPEPAVADMVGEGARVLVERALATTGHDPAAAPAALQRFLALYDSRLLHHTRAYEGIPDMLTRLRNDGVRLAVLTNKPHAAAVRILEGLQLGAMFDHVVGGDGPYPRKPNPAALLALIERSGSAPDATCMVGDSRIDLETATRAGVRVCLAGYGFGFRFESSEIEGVEVARTPWELAKILHNSETTEAQRHRDAQR